MAALLGNGGDSELALQGINFTYILPWHLEIYDYSISAPCNGAFHSFPALVFPFGINCAGFSRRFWCCGICNSVNLCTYLHVGFILFQLLAMMHFHSFQVLVLPFGANFAGFFP